MLKKALVKIQISILTKAFYLPIKKPPAKAGGNL